jgi:sensor c-di-GMP phosphodiesterase-like protein
VWHGGHESRRGDIQGSSACTPIQEVFSYIEFMVKNQRTAMFSIDEIRSALDNQEFFLEYMPTMSLTDKRCVGAEALIRWRQGDRIVQPMEFIPMIENTPLSGAITYWVIDMVAKELGSWLREQHAVRISINVPPEIIGRGGLQYAAEKSRLCDVLDKLVLEVTERGLLDPLGIAGINEIAESKVLIALDDVSTNDASLIVLSRVPAHIVKLEKSFADQMLREDWSHKEIAGIAALIQSGNLNVIAEGIETETQVDILMKAGIQMAQGWYFSQSLPASDFIAYFSAHQ